MKRIFRSLLTSLLLALPLTACQSLAEQDDANKLNNTLDNYGATVRWQPLAGLYAYLEPELQPKVVPEGLDRLRVTGYEVIVPPRKLAEDRVEQTAAIEYVHVDRQVVRKLIDRQLWQRNADKRWLRANPIPAFK